MKTFQSVLFSTIIFTFIFLSSSSSIIAQTFEEGDKVELKLKINKQEVWIPGTYERFYKGKHRATYSYNIEGWRGGGEMQPFADSDIRPFEGNTTTSFGESAKTTEAKPESPFKKGEQVEIKITVNKQDVWIAGTYDLFHKGTHRVSYQYDIDGWNGFGKMKPFEEANIRAFEGNITTSFYEDALEKSFEEGEKVEINLTVNGESVWVEGTYNQAYQGKHRVSYDYEVNGFTGQGHSMPFGDSDIRVYIGDVFKSFDDTYK